MNKSAYEDKNYYLNFSKAFDKWPHQRQANENRIQFSIESRRGLVTGCKV